MTKQFVKKTNYIQLNLDYTNPENIHLEKNTVFFSANTSDARAAAALRAVDTDPNSAFEEYVSSATMEALPEIHHQAP